MSGFLLVSPGPSPFQETQGKVLPPESSSDRSWKLKSQHGPGDWKPGSTSSFRAEASCHWIKEGPLDKNSASRSFLSCNMFIEKKRGTVWRKQFDRSSQHQ